MSFERARTSGATSGGPRGAIAVLRWRLLARVRDLVAQLGLLGAIHRLQHLRDDRRRAAEAGAYVPLILERAAAASGDAAAARWRADHVVRTVSDVTVLTVGPPLKPFEALVKVADTPAAAAGLRWQCDAIDRLRSDQRLGDWRSLLPQVLDAGEAGGRAYLVERRHGDVSLDRRLVRRAQHASVLREAAAAIRPLHEATAHAATIDAQIIERWVLEPTSLLAEVVRSGSKERAMNTSLDRLTEELATTLEHEPIMLSWVHGDYGPGNILTDHGGQISGIVDWEFAQPADFPSLDLVTLLLTCRMVVRRQELGRVVCDLVAEPRWNDDEAAVVGAAPDAAACERIGVTRVALLCWLRHTAWMIGRGSSYASSGLWLHTNVRSVLAAID